MTATDKTTDCRVLFQIVWLFEGKQLAGVAVGAGDAGGAAAAVQAAETGGQNKG